MSKYQRGGALEPIPQLLFPELKDEFERPSYAPTPLNPYGLMKDGIPYVTHAHNVVMDVFTKNLSHLPVRPADVVVDLLETSITGELFRRFENNSGKILPADCDEETSQLFVAACLGSATPGQLIELLGRRPGDLESIELAKHTQPFDWNATVEMDVAIDTILDESHFAKRGSERTQNTRYYYVRSDNNQQPSAAIIVRKADMGVRPCGTDSDMIVVQRDSFVLDLMHEETQAIGQEVRAWLQSEEARTRIIGNKKARYIGATLTQFISTQLTTRSDLRSRALYPGARSYYAFCEVGPAASDSLTDT